MSHLWVERGQRSGYNDCMGALDRKMDPHSLDDSVRSQRHRDALASRYTGVASSGLLSKDPLVVH